MKRFFCLLFIAIAVSSMHAQDNSDKVYYKYIVAEVNGGFLFTKCRVYIDDGHLQTKKEFKKQKRAYTFETHAAAINYFTYKGWELVGNNNNTHGYGGSSSTTTYWILRKPASKDEIEGILNESVVEIPSDL